MALGRTWSRASSRRRPARCHAASGSPVYKYTPRRNTSVSCSRPRCLRWVCRAAYLSKSSRKSSASRLICLRSPSLASGVSRPASLATSARCLRRSLSLSRRPSSCLRFRSICAHLERNDVNGIQHRHACLENCVVANELVALIVQDDGREARHRLVEGQRRDLAREWEVRAPCEELNLRRVAGDVPATLRQPEAVVGAPPGRASPGLVAALGDECLQGAGEAGV